MRNVRNATLPSTVSYTESRVHGIGICSLHELKSERKRQFYAVIHFMFSATEFIPNGLSLRLQRNATKHSP
jgi:hypothetical protein